MKCFKIGLLTFYILLFFNINVNAQVTTSLTLDEVVEVSGLSKDTIYERANMWFLDIIHSSRGSEILINDKVSGLIKGKRNRVEVSYKSQIGITLKEIITYTITIEIREGRCRISFSNPSTASGTLVQGLTGIVGAAIHSTSEAVTNIFMDHWKLVIEEFKNSLITDNSSW